MSYEVPVEKLRKICDPRTINCDTSEELQAARAIIGQERATRSLRFGLGIKASGFNIYVAGRPGTGRTPAVTQFLEEIARDKSAPSDWCYVNNFRDLSRPNAIRLPTGRAREFQREMRNLVEKAQQGIRKAFEGEEYTTQRNETSQSFQKRQEEIEARVNGYAQQEGFLIQPSPTGIMTIPVKAGRPLTQEEFMLLDQEQKDAISKKQKAVQSELATGLRQIKNLEKEAEEEVRRLDRQVALYAVSHLLDDTMEKYRDLPEVVAYLNEVQNDILENLAAFRADAQEPSPFPFPVPKPKEQLFKRYAVNALVDNSALKGAPVVMEANPTYNNLFGRSENEAQFGTLVTDFTLIRQGSLHRANGGYLVLPAEEVLRNPFSWDSLKRALRNQAILIEDAGERLGFLTTKTLQPAPIPLDVKVILIGQPSLYHLLYSLDEDFSELFKIKADFNSVMDRTDKSVQDYSMFVSALCSNEHIKHLDRTALAKIVEHGSRLAEDQFKLSTRFGEISDVIREGSYYATQESLPYATAAHVSKAIDEKFHRSNLLQERIREMIENSTLMIEVQGEKVG